MAAAAATCPLPFPAPPFSPYSAIAAIKKAGYAYCDLKTRREKTWPLFTPREADAAEELIIAGRRGKAGISIADLAPRLNLTSHAWTRKLVRNAETKIASVSKQRGFQSPIEVSARIRLKDGTEKKIPGKRGGRRNWYEFSLEGLKQLSPFYKPKPPSQPKPQTVPEKVNSYEQPSIIARPKPSFDRAFEEALRWLREGPFNRTAPSVHRSAERSGDPPARSWSEEGTSQSKIPSDAIRDPGDRAGDPPAAKGPPGRL